MQHLASIRVDAALVSLLARNIRSQGVAMERWTCGRRNQAPAASITPPPLAGARGTGYR